MRRLLTVALLLLTQLSAATYEYDELNRLKTATYENGVVYTYSYDDAGNLLSVISSGAGAPSGSNTGPGGGTGGNDIDTDGDGISDAREHELKLDINNADTDHDGISDLEEIGDISHPRDTDHDGTIDALDTDSDNDGMSDADEHRYGLNPLVDDARADSDGDGVNNIDEIRRGTNPGLYLKPIPTVYLSINGDSKTISLEAYSTQAPLEYNATSADPYTAVVSEIVDNNITLTPVSEYEANTTVTVSVATHGMRVEEDIAVNVVSDANRSEVEETTTGGGCTYNPRSRGFDLTMLLMLVGSLLYPFRRRFIDR